MSSRTIDITSDERYDSDDDDDDSDDSDSDDDDNNDVGVGRSDQGRRCRCRRRRRLCDELHWSQSIISYSVLMKARRRSRLWSSLSSLSSSSLSSSSLLLGMKKEMSAKAKATTLVMILVLRSSAVSSLSFVSWSSLSSSSVFFAPSCPLATTTTTTTPTKIHRHCLGSVGNEGFEGVSEGEHRIGYGGADGRRRRKRPDRRHRRYRCRRVEITAVAAAEAEATMTTAETDTSFDPSTCPLSTFGPIKSDFGLFDEEQICGGGDYDGNVFGNGEGRDKDGVGGIIAAVGSGRGGLSEVVSFLSPMRPSGATRTLEYYYRPIWWRSHSASTSASASASASAWLSARPSVVAPASLPLSVAPLPAKKRSDVDDFIETRITQRRQRRRRRRVHVAEEGKKGDADKDDHDDEINESSDLTVERKIYDDPVQVDVRNQEGKDDDDDDDDDDVERALSALLSEIKSLPWTNRQDLRLTLARYGSDDSSDGGGGGGGGAIVRETDEVLREALTRSPDLVDAFLDFSPMENYSSSSSSSSSLTSSNERDHDSGGRNGSADVGEGQDKEGKEEEDDDEYFCDRDGDRIDTDSGDDDDDDDDDENDDARRTATKQIEKEKTVLSFSPSETTTTKTTTTTTLGLLSGLVDKVGSISRSAMIEMLVRHPTLMSSVLRRSSMLRTKEERLMSDLNLSDAEIAKIARTLGEGPFKRLNRTKIREVLWYFRTDVRLTDEQLKKMLVLRPQLLLYSVANMRCKVSFFQTELGMSKEEFARMIRTVPLVLAYSVENRLRPTVEFLRKEIGSSKWKWIAYRYPQIFSYSLDNTLRPKCRFFKEKLKLNRPSDISQLASKFPPTLWLPEETILSKVNFLREELDLSEDELRDILVTFPQVLGLSLEENLRPTVRFLLGGGGERIRGGGGSGGGGGDVSGEGREGRREKWRRGRSVPAGIGGLGVDKKATITYPDDDDDYDDESDGAGLTRQKLKEFVLYQPALLAYSLENRLRPRIRRMKESDICFGYAPPNIMSKTDAKFDEWFESQTGSWCISE